MDERRALLGLWAIPGVGAKTVRMIRDKIDLEQICDALIGEWIGEFDKLPSQAYTHLPRGRTLAFD